MTDEVSSLILEHLRALRTGQGVLERKLDDLTLRVSSLEKQVAGLREDMAFLHSRIDHLDVRVSRIEKRLELVEP